jgi:hypothetical protein
MTVTHEELQRNLIAGGERFDKIEKTLEGIAEKLEPIPDMQKDIAKTREIVETYETIKNIAIFVKWASGVVAGLLAIWVFMKAMAKGLLS